MLILLSTQIQEVLVMLEMVEIKTKPSMRVYSTSHRIQPTTMPPSLRSYRAKLLLRHTLAREEYYFP
jgi:hypothetical protein